MRRLITAILMLLFLTGMVYAEDITISTSVDRTEVEFGDTLELTVQIKKPMESSSSSSPNGFSSSGFSFSFNSSSFSSMNLNDIDFDIESVPGFDIAGRRQSSQSRMINGVGESVKSIILSLVPQKVGTLVIPAFSMKDKDGKEHTSKPITINVKKVADEPEEQGSDASEEENKDDNSNVTQNTEAKKENTLFNVYFILGIVLVVVIIAIIAFFYFFDYLSKQHKKASEQSVEDAVIVKEEPNVAKEESKKPIKLEKVEKVERVEFATIAASLKVQYKEVSPEFYKKYFELFKKACCYRSNALSKDMTYDELLNKCSELAGTNNITQASSRLAHDIEMVMYAGSMPNRQLIAIETDIKEVLNSL